MFINYSFRLKIGYTVRSWLTCHFRVALSTTKTVSAPFNLIHLIQGLYYEQVLHYLCNIKQYNLSIIVKKYNII